MVIDHPLPTEISRQDMKQHIQFYTYIKVLQRKKESIDTFLEKCGEKKKKEKCGDTFLFFFFFKIFIYSRETHTQRGRDTEGEQAPPHKELIVGLDSQTWDHAIS